ncbi:hypothetical protein AB0M79_35125 [Polymorphospora sp. NPDC051019]|uniref:hypothetical protein n=1 Tax=Polymorphospora sp. NPDC051019 TaxID=3155725 RepID=UPI00342FDADA
MSSVLLNRETLDLLRNLASSDLAAHVGDLYSLEGYVLPVVRIRPAEVIDSYRIRADIAEGAGKVVSGHSRFMMSMRRGGEYLYIGNVDVGSATIYMIFNGDLSVPLGWMAIHHQGGDVECNGG